MDCAIEPELVFERYGRPFAINSDGTILIFYDLANKEVVIHDFNTNQYKTINCKFKPEWIVLSKNNDIFFIIDRYGLIQIFCTHTEKFIRKIASGVTSPYVFAISPDNATLVTSGSSVKIYDVTTGLLKHTIIDHRYNSDIYIVAYSSNGTMFASCAYKAGLQLWNAETYQKIYEVSAIGNNYINYVTFSPDGSLIAYSLNGYITVLHVITFEVIYRGEHKNVISIAISHDNLKMITSFISDTKVWNILNGQLIHTFNSQFSLVAFTQNSNMIVIGDRSYIRIWRINKLGHRTKQALHIKEFDDLNVLTDESKLNDLTDGDKSNDLPDSDKLNDLTDEGKSNDLTDEGKSNDSTDECKSNDLTDDRSFNDSTDKSKLNELTDEGKSNDSINDKTNDLLVKSIDSTSNKIICHDLGELDLDELNELIS